MEKPACTEDDHAMLGSLGAITGKNMAGDVFLPDWLEQGVESSLRDTEEDAPAAPLSLSSAQTSVPRSIASSNRATPIVLTPTGPSPAGSYSRPESGKAPWTDLDSFYADTNEEEEEEEEESEEETDEGEEEEENGEESSEGEEHQGSVEPEESGEEESDSAEEDDDHEGEEHNLLHTSR